MLLGAHHFSFVQAGLGGGAIGGISVGVIAGVLLLAGGIYFGIFRKNKVDTKFLIATSEDQSSPNGRCKLLVSLFLFPYRLFDVTFPL